MSDSDNIDDLYAWINERYEAYTRDEIDEETYLAELEEYKKRLVEFEEQEKPVKKVEKKVDQQSISPEKVRSTSIAGLRKKLLDEMRK